MPGINRKNFHLILTLVGAVFWMLPAYSANAKNSRNSIDSEKIELANLRADLALLQQQVSRFSLELEKLSRENRELKNNLQIRLEQQEASLARLATVAELNNRMAAAREEMLARLSAEKSEIIIEVSSQMERLANQTQEAMKALAESVAAKPTISVERTFSEDYPKKGVAYTVESGDTLSAIAKKFNSTVADIQNANKIADPKGLKAGQTIFVPQSSK